MVLRFHIVEDHMQTTPSKPKRSTLSKILIGVVAIILACCGVSAIGAVLSPSRPATPTPTVAVIVSMSTQEALPTIALPTQSPTHTPLPPTPPSEATIPPTAVPTESPIATEPPASTVAPAGSELSLSEYSAVMTSIALRSSDNLQNFTGLIQRATRDSVIMLSSDWKTEMNTVLATMRVNADEYRRIAPPGNMRDVHNLVIEMADTMDRVANNMGDVVNKQDLSKTEQIVEDLNTITALAQQISAMLKSK
jgi:hypothetical protein